MKIKCTKLYAPIYQDNCCIEKIIYNTNLRRMIISKDNKKKTTYIKEFKASENNLQQTPSQVFLKN